MLNRVVPAMALVSAGQALLVREEDSEDSCTCLKWGEVYSTYNVTCGQGLEFYHRSLAKNMTVHNKTDPTLLAQRKQFGKKFCTNFFERLPANFGVRMKFNTEPSEAGRKWYDASWCYVKNACTKLQGGQPIPGTTVAWRVANGRYNKEEATAEEKRTEGMDRIFTQLQPEVLVWQIARKSNIDASVLLGYSYYSQSYVDMPAKAQPKYRYGDPASEDSTMYWTKLAVDMGVPTVLRPLGLPFERIIKANQAWDLRKNATATSARQNATPAIALVAGAGMVGSAAGGAQQVPIYTIEKVNLSSLPRDW